MGLFDKITGAFHGGASADISISIGSQAIERGGEFTLGYTITPRTSFKARSLHADIFSTEQINPADCYNTDGHRRLTPMESHIYSDRIGIAGETEFTEGQPLTGEAKIKIPASAQPTYTGNSAKNTWTVKLVVDMPMAMDLAKEQPITVR